MFGKTLWLIVQRIGLHQFYIVIKFSLNVYVLDNRCAVEIDKQAVETVGKIYAATKKIC